MARPADVENTPDSVFCSHGAGYVVKWNEVPEHAHIDTSSMLKPKEEEPEQVRPARSSGTGGGLTSRAAMSRSSSHEKMML